MLVNVLLIAGGLVLLVLGGNWLVTGAVNVATRMRISKAIVGVVLVGFGTSTPELAASVQAAIAGAPDMTVGNVVGSNSANIMLILGLAALIAPFSIPRAGFARDMLWLFLSSGALIALLWFGEVGRLAAGAMVAGLLVYLAWAVMDEGRSRAAGGNGEAPPEAAVHAHSLWLSLLMTAGGIVVTIIGARLLVDGAVDLARALQVTDALIGLTIVAVGTSLPELAASIIAARKGHGEIAYSNIVGSNIYNILGVLGLTALFTPLPAAEQIVRVDMWVMAAATLAMALFAWTRHRIYRWEGAVLFLGYCAYLAWLVWDATQAA